MSLSGSETWQLWTSCNKRLISAFQCDSEQPTGRTVSSCCQALSDVLLYGRLISGCRLWTSSRRGKRAITFCLQWPFTADGAFCLRRSYDNSPEMDSRPVVENTPESQAEIERLTSVPFKGAMRPPDLTSLPAQKWTATPLDLL